jgi:serine acetyltransferase
LSDEGQRPRSGLRSKLARDAAASKAYQLTKFGYRPLTWFLDPGFAAVFLSRLQIAAGRRSLPLLPSFLQQLCSALTGADIETASTVGPGWLMPNPLGVSFWGNAGEDLTICGLSGAGHAIGGRLAAGGKPHLGDRVTLGVLTGIQGPLTVGDGAVLSPGSGARRSIPPGVIVRSAAPPVEGPPLALRRAEAGRSCAHGGLGGLFGDFRTDLDRTAEESERLGMGRPRRIKLLFRNMFVALFIYRLAHLLSCRGWGAAAAPLTLFNRLVFKLHLPAETCLGGGVMIPHLGGTFLAAQAGAHLSVFAQGWVSGWYGETGPVLGPRAFIAAHASVCGPVSLGEGAALGPKAAVFEDVPANTVVNAAVTRFRLEEGEGHEPGPQGVLPADVLSLGTLMKQDRDRAKALSAAGYRVDRLSRLSVRLYRLSAAVHARGGLRRARWLWLFNRYLTGLDISPASRIGGGLAVLQPAGVLFHGRAGADLLLHGQCVVGCDLDARRRLRPVVEQPVLSDGVVIMPHAIVTGPLEIGRETVLYPGAVPVQNVPDRVHIYPPPSRWMEKREGA